MEDLDEKVEIERNGCSLSSLLNGKQNDTNDVAYGRDSIRVAGNNIRNGVYINTELGNNSITAQYQNNISTCSLRVEIKKWRLNGMGVAFKNKRIDTTNDCLYFGKYKKEVA